MKHSAKKWIALVLAIVLAVSATVIGITCSASPAGGADYNTSMQARPYKQPKYVFLFIGDGMTFPQFQLAANYLGATSEHRYDPVLYGPIALNFMNFPFVGTASTFDAGSFIPDSASTGTAIASGFKTYSGTLNMDESQRKTYTTIAEQLHNSAKKRIGIVTSVNVNHATPAAFYAHQPSRNNHYDIGLEMIYSGFEYFAGGALLKPNGADGTQASLYDIAAKKGYKVIRTQAEAEKATANDGKLLVIGEHLADGGALEHEIDRAEGHWALADYVKKGIEVLDNKYGFFMMCEGGKIDWACHANDAGTVIHDVVALGDAVQVALDFAKEHADETLILVTGDHETGGLTIGYAGTDYQTYLRNLDCQKISYAKYNAERIEYYLENKLSFEDAMKDVENYFGLVLPQYADRAQHKTLALTDYEVQQLREAYTLTKRGYQFTAEGDPIQTREEKMTYGTYTPFCVTITHILNNKSGLNFSTYSHSGLPTAVYAYGAGAEQFMGSYDNTDIHDKLCNVLGLKKLAN